MRRRFTPQVGLTLVELAVVLGVLGIVSAAVAGLIGWSVRLQARQESTHLMEESAHLALDRVARLLRTAGAYGRPALLVGESDSLVLCGLSWAGRGVRASVRLEGGALVLAPVSSSGNPGGCSGIDLATRINLVPESTFSDLRFRYAFRYATAEEDLDDSCSNLSRSPCTAVTGVLIRVTPRGASSGSQLFVALRNSGGP